MISVFPRSLSSMVLEKTSKEIVHRQLLHDRDLLGQLESGVQGVCGSYRCNHRNVGSILLTIPINSFVDQVSWDGIQPRQNQSPFEYLEDERDRSIHQNLRPDPKHDEEHRQRQSYPFDSHYHLVPQQWTFWESKSCIVTQP